MILPAGLLSNIVKLLMVHNVILLKHPWTCKLCNLSSAVFTSYSVTLLDRLSNQTLNQKNCGSIFRCWLLR